jgi:phosphopantetheinyl transferase (holo-ACP synthase)
MTGSGALVRSLPAAVFAAGLDLADLDRLALALRRSGTGFRDRVLSPAEVALTGGDPERFAALFSIKESVVKTLHGLPRGGCLRDIELTALPAPGAPPVAVHLRGELAGWAGRQAATVLAGVAAGTGQVVLTWAVATPTAPAPVRSPR